MYAVLLAWDEGFLGVSFGKWFLGFFVGYYCVQIGFGNYEFEVDVEEIKKSLKEALTEELEDHPSETPHTKKDTES